MSPSHHASISEPRRVTHIARMSAIDGAWVSIIIFFLSSCPRTGHIYTLDTHAAPHVVPACCGQGKCWEICGVAYLRDAWVCVRLELFHERWLGAVVEWMRGQAQELGFSHVVTALSFIPVPLIFYIC